MFLYHTLYIHQFQFYVSAPLSSDTCHWHVSDSHCSMICFWYFAVLSAYNTIPVKCSSQSSDLSCDKLSTTGVSIYTLFYILLLLLLWQDSYHNSSLLLLVIENDVVNYFVQIHIPFPEFFSCPSHLHPQNPFLFYVFLLGESKIIPQWLRIFNQIFYMPSHLSKLHNFIELSLNLTKLCHIKCNYPVNFYISLEFLTF